MTALRCGRDRWSRNCGDGAAVSSPRQSE